MPGVWWKPLRRRKLPVQGAVAVDGQMVDLPVVERRGVPCSLCLKMFRIGDF